MNEKFILAGDIGGTKTSIALFSQKKGPYAPVFEKMLASAEIHDFCAIVKDFIQNCQITPDACCLGVAGPVFNGTAEITKLGWQLSERDIQAQLNIPFVSVINDLVATAYGLPILQKTDICVINKGQADPCGAKIIVAPGTGLGEVFLTLSQDEYQVHPSEGGHTLFAPATKLQHELLGYLNDAHGQITYDFLCSGRGIPLIYSFLKDKNNISEASWLIDKLRRCDDPTPHIIESAVNPDRNDPLSVQTLDIFIEILASEAANFALKILSTGGVYLAGGIPPRIVGILKRKSFLDCFSARKPFQSFLTDVPVSIIINPKAALIGAACQAMKSGG